MNLIKHGGLARITCCNAYTNTRCIKRYASVFIWFIFSCITEFLVLFIVTGHNLVMSPFSVIASCKRPFTFHETGHEY